jgi:hypothetical protein
MGAAAVELNKRVINPPLSNPPGSGELVEPQSASPALLLARTSCLEPL